MNESLARYAANRDDPVDQPLTEAARVALEANPNPRYIKMRVAPSGTPIEIPEDELDQPIADA